MKFIKQHTAFVLILILCALLRLIPLFDYQLTLDEISGLDRTFFDSFGELIDKGVKIDAHPAFVQVLIYYLVRCFGYVTWIVKLPFLLFGFGAVTYAYALAFRHFSKQAAVFAAAVLSFSLIFVFYAPIARMYISGVFFSAALLYYFFEIVFRETRTGSTYVLFGLFAWLCALNQHINALFAFTVCAGGVFFLKKETWKPYVITCALVVLSYLPHLPVTLYQLGVGGIGFKQGGWLEAPALSAVLGFLKVVLGTGRTWMLFVILIAIAIISSRKFYLDKKQVFLLGVFLFNYLVVYAYSVFRAPVFQYSVMLFSGVAFILFLCSLLEFKNQYVFYSASILLSAALLYKSYIKKNYLRQAVKTVFEYQFERTAHYKILYGEAAVYPILFDADATMKKIYFPVYGAFDCKVSGDPETSGMRAFSHFVASLGCDYLVLASSMPAYQAVAQQYFPYLVENTQTQAVNYKVYSKRAADASRTVEDDKVLHISTPLNHGAFTYLKMQDPKPEIILSDSLNEYPFDAAADYTTVIDKEGEMLLLKVRFKVNSSESRITSCVSVNDQSTNESYMYAARAASDFVMRSDSTVTAYTDMFFGTPHQRAKDRSRITCYVWNRGREKFTMTGFEIRVIDYWPMKWHFWD